MADTFLLPYSILNSKRRWTVFCKKTQKLNTLIPQQQWLLQFDKNYDFKENVKKIVSMYYLQKSTFACRTNKENKLKE